MKGNQTGAIIAIIAVLVLCGGMALAIVFNLFGLRDALSSVIPALAPKEESSLAEEILEPEVSVSAPSAAPEPPPQVSAPEPEPAQPVGLYSIETPIAPQYQDYYSYDDYGYALVDTGSGWGVIDKRGQYVVEPIYDRIYSFADDYAIFYLDGYYGLLDREGYHAVEPVWEDVYFYSEGLMPALQNGKWGYVDLDGNTVIPFQYDDVFSFTEGYAVVILGENYFYIDLSGQVASGYFQEAYPFSEGLASVMQNGKWGYIDESFQVVIPCIYDSAYDFEDGIAVVLQNDMYLCIDDLGEVVMPAVEDLYLCEDGYALALESDLYGLYDLQSQSYVISPQYYDMMEYGQGLVPVTLDGADWFYVDLTNTPRLEGGYEGAMPFAEEIGRVMQNGKWGLIDQEGTLIAPCEWDWIATPENGMIPVEKNGLWGYLEIVKNP